jgi:hypothetical protein
MPGVEDQAGVVPGVEDQAGVGFCPAKPKTEWVLIRRQGHWRGSFGGSMG